jgi:hypothetical protein
MIENELLKTMLMIENQDTKLWSWTTHGECLNGKDQVTADKKNVEEVNMDTSGMLMGRQR